MCSYINQWEVIQVCINAFHLSVWLTEALHRALQNPDLARWGGGGRAHVLII